MLRLPLRIRNRPLLLCCTHNIICIIISGCFRPDTFSPNPLRPHGLTVVQHTGRLQSVSSLNRLSVLCPYQLCGGATAFLPCFMSSDITLELEMAASNRRAFWRASCWALTITRLHPAMSLGPQVPRRWDLPFLDHIVNKNKNGDLSKTFILSVSSFLYVVYTLRGWGDSWAVCRGLEFNSQKIHNGL